MQEHRPSVMSLGPMADKQGQAGLRRRISARCSSLTLASGLHASWWCTGSRVEIVSGSCGDCLREFGHQKELGRDACINPEPTPDVLYTDRQPQSYLVASSTYREPSGNS